LISLQPKMCLLAYRSTYNAFLMNLPVPTFVFLHSKSVNLHWLPFLNRNHTYFHSGYFDYRSAFRIVPDFYCCIMGTGAQAPFFVFIVAILVTEVLFVEFLLCFAV